MRPLGFALLAALALAAPAARAGSPDIAQAPHPALERRSWAQEVRHLRAQERAQLADLERAVREAAPGASRAGAQRALESAKRAWNRRMLDMQLARVRAAGLAAQARQLEQRIGDLDALAAGRRPAAPAGGER